MRELKDERELRNSDVNETTHDLSDTTKGQTPTDVDSAENEQSKPANKIENEEDDTPEDKVIDNNEE